jgi:hypothetical protein
LLSALEQHVIKALLLQGTQPSSSNFPNVFPNVTVTLVDSSGGPALETQQWAILAILAHEMGHLFWHNICDGKNDQKTQTGCDNVFHNSGWAILADTSHPWHLRQFGTTINGATHRLPAPPDSAQLENDRWPFPHLKDLYSSDTWSDMFSFIAPDEEIAEAYKFMALMEASDSGTILQSMVIQVPDEGTPATGGWSSDIVARLKNPLGLLALKVSLLRACVPLSSLSPIATSARPLRLPAGDGVTTCGTLSATGFFRLGGRL